MTIEQIAFYGITVIIVFVILVLANRARRETISKLENEIVWLRSQLDNDNYLQEEVRETLTSITKIHSRLYKLEETGEMK